MKDAIMGRPISSNPRRQQLNLSLTDDELRSICMRAAAVGMRPVHFGRAILLSDGNHVAAPDNHLSRLIHQQLVRLGSNLNQIARHYNRTGDPPPADLEPLLRDIRQIITKVRA
jgi:hypothetical protein